MTDSEPHFSFFLLRHEGEIALVTITREQLTDDENLEQLDQELTRVLGEESGRRMICDLSAVKYLTSSAIGKLISLHRKSIRTGSRIVLCGLQPTVREILGTSHLLEYFSITPDAENAIAELN
ncbi:STAS domain-containing protein [Thalassoglobus sp.]|uniref:STAS domain-containing protein n=1 Tax=Thalassoglobus sp. TaxID=2795869 RepID=UPI003AA8E239